MLKIFNLLKPFFEDVYREFSVREYGRIKKLSPPTASKALKQFSKENLLIKTKRGIYLIFRANKEYHLFKDLAIAYWHERLFHLFENIHEKVLFKPIILFGSIAKTENTAESDLDIYIDIPRRELNIGFIEKKLKRKVQLHFKEESKNPHLLENIKKGIIIK
jgi:predicted nucleotidyltransferase